MTSELEYHYDFDSASSESDSCFLPEKTEGIEVQGGRLTYKRTGPGGPGGGLRGRVKGMSDASRRRLMGVFASLDWGKLIAAAIPFHFVTLTTPEVYWADERGVFKALQRFRKRLYRGFPGFLGAFVRRERGAKRGMLHYHLITVGARGLSAAWVQAAWSESLRYEGKVRVDVQLPEDPNRVAKYLSKYCAKVGYDGAYRPGGGVPSGGTGSVDPAPLSKAHNWPDGCTGGRWWYVWGKELLPWGVAYTLLGEDGRGIAKRVRRIFRRWRASKVREAYKKKHFGSWEMELFWRRADWQTSVKRWSSFDRFCTSLGRGGGRGFTLLLSPELLERFLEAAAYGYIHINQGVPF